MSENSSVVGFEIDLVLSLLWLFTVRIELETMWNLSHIVILNDPHTDADRIRPPILEPSRHHHDQSSESCDSKKTKSNEPSHRNRSRSSEQLRRDRPQCIDRLHRDSPLIFISPDHKEPSHQNRSAIDKVSCRDRHPRKESSDRDRSHRLDASDRIPRKSTMKEPSQGE